MASLFFLTLATTATATTAATTTAATTTTSSSTSANDSDPTKALIPDAQGYELGKSFNLM